MPHFPIPSSVFSPYRLGGLACLILCTTLLQACTTSDYTMFEYRNGSKIIDGEGGSKRTVDGVEIWDAGDPPHRYRIMGMIRVSDYDMAYVNTTMLHAIAQQVRHSGGSAAILLNSNGGMRTAIDSMTWHERLGTPQENGYRILRALVVQYLPEQASTPTTASAPQTSKPAKALKAVR
ncbi:hypothetical protein [Aquitalea sp. LB_tupeE]|uniref:hypothetical protein n=1 Tax=Aquitalea sp. LB_tupeE TaxID=2748078 RepID=UPI0015BCE8B4|nr:hypothetical protein [Aquitalea sp. LB_tupeE]NWK77231.1 hypothetical protein [Aquitalea sp. LB_tupeE]